MSVFYGLGFPSALSLNDFIVLGGGNRIKKMWLGSGVGRGGDDEGGVGIRWEITIVEGSRQIDVYRGDECRLKKAYD